MLRCVERVWLRVPMLAGAAAGGRALCRLSTPGIPSLQCVAHWGPGTCCCNGLAVVGKPLASAPVCWQPLPLAVFRFRFGGGGSPNGGTGCFC